MPVTGVQTCALPIFTAEDVTSTATGVLQQTNSAHSDGTHQIVSYADHQTLGSSGSASDFLVGGGVDQTFRFDALGFGLDQINNFNTAGGAGVHDTLAFSTSLFADIAAYHSAAMTMGNDVVIHAGADTLIAKNVTAAALEADVKIF